MATTDEEVDEATTDYQALDHGVEPPSIAADPPVAASPVVDDYEDNEQAQTVRLAMTMLLALLLPALLLSLWAADNYHLIITVFWIILALGFIGLVGFVQHVTTHPVVLHPAIHHFAETVKQEYYDLVADWRHALLMIEYDQEWQGDREDLPATPPTVRPTRRPKSRVFRLLKPLLPLVGRRRRRRKNDQPLAETELV